MHHIHPANKRNGNKTAVAFFPERIIGFSFHLFHHVATDIGGGNANKDDADGRQHHWRETWTM